jgi:hypothetical protein
MPARSKARVRRWLRLNPDGSAGAGASGVLLDPAVVGSMMRR